MVVLLEVCAIAAAPPNAAPAKAQPTLTLANGMRVMPSFSKADFAPDSCGDFGCGPNCGPQPYEPPMRGKGYVFTDIGMPEEDGYELIRRVRARESAEGGHVPAIALTAYARSDDRTKAIRSGFQNHLAKPVEPAELLAIVGSLANRG